jgi:lathosterol oxidase
MIQTAHDSNAAIPKRPCPRILGRLPQPSKDGSKSAEARNLTPCGFPSYVEQHSGGQDHVDDKRADEETSRTMRFEEKLLRAARSVYHIALGEAFWYLTLAALVWIALYVVLWKVLRNRKIAEGWPTRSQVGHEFLYSLRSLVLFGLVGGCVVFARLSGWTQLYWKISAYGWTWFVVSIAILIVLHDTYFYWTHRLMHHPRLFHAFHRAHHISVRPTPWAAYAFSPLEALVQAGIAPLALCAIPVHPLAFSLFMFWQILFNVVGHCGYEIYPPWFVKTWIGRFLNTPTHHAMHHEKFRSNFGLYFSFWDRLMGTNHATYEDRFAQIAGGTAQHQERNRALPHAP